MKPLLLCTKLLAFLCAVTLSSAAVAGTWTDRYWPLHDGDVRVFNYSGGQMLVNARALSSTVFEVSFETDEEDGAEIHERTATGIYLSEVHANGKWIKVTFNPDILLFDDALFEIGGTRTTSVTARQSGVSYPATFTVKVARAGTVVVPAGTFVDCRNVTVTEKATVPGQGTVSATTMTAVLAPRAGLIKKRLGNGEWAVLSSGTVGGVDVRQLAGSTGAKVVTQISGSGSVSPDYAGQTLAAGKSYSLTAVPAAGHIFSHWEGSLSGTNPKVTFIAQGDMTIRAVFVPNPFAPLKGLYRGLVREAAGVLPRSTGYLTATVTDRGGYSGALTLGGKRYAFSGLLDATGKGSTVFKAGAPVQAIDLVLDAVSPDDRLGGTVVGQGWTAVIEGDRSTFDGKTTPTPLAGAYTLIFPGSGDSAAHPGGDGYGTALVDLAGNVRFSGVLADGSKVTQAGGVSTTGEWPLYVALSKGQGVLAAWATFAVRPGEDLFGDGAWIKPAALAGSYRAGFSIPITLSGSRYTAPALGNNPLGSSTAEARLQGAYLAGPMEQSVQFDANGKVTNGGPDFGLSMVRTTGLFSGFAAHPAGGKPLVLRGVVLQKSRTARGFFLDQDRSGQVWLGAD